MWVVGFWDMGTWWVGVCLPVCVCVRVALECRCMFVWQCVFLNILPFPYPHKSTWAFLVCLSVCFYGVCIWMFVFGCLYLLAYVSLIQVPCEDSLATDLSCSTS